MASRTRKKGPSASFADLTWDDLDRWAGSRIVSRGRNYQQQGRVAELARTRDGELIGWVEGSQRYATKVSLAEGGLADAVCTCPYFATCKHAVALVLEYLACIETNRRVPQASDDDERFALLEPGDWEEAFDDIGPCRSAPASEETKRFLKDKTKAQLVELLVDLAAQHPDVAQCLVDRREISRGDVKALVTRTAKEIHEMPDTPGWRDSWQGEGYTPDYSGIRRKLQLLLDSGRIDDVLALGAELLVCGRHVVEQSDDEGETHEEVAACVAVIAEALDQSSLAPGEKLAWSVEAVLKDQYELCTPFVELLNRRHPRSAWHDLADGLLAELASSESSVRAGDFSRSYARNRLSNWAIYALDRAGRTEDILPLCRAEASKTDSYERLVGRLMAERLYDEAEHWIQTGIKATETKWPGTAHGLRGRLKEIRIAQKDLPAVAAHEVEDFVRCPSPEPFAGCEEASRKARMWPKV